MKTALIYLSLLPLLLLWAGRAYAEPQLYTCGMHPEFVTDKPGNCPICGMKLVPVRGEPPAAGAPRIHVDEATVQRMNIRTAIVGRGPLQRSLRAVGIVAYDESRVREVTIDYDGWVEKLYVTSTGTPVKAGDPLFEIYIPTLYPDLHASQLTYVAPSELIPGTPSLKEERRGLLYRSPATGVVIDKQAVEGQRIKAGERIFRLADLSSVWVNARIYENDLPYVHEGEPVVVRETYGAEREFEGSVQRILPQVDELTRTAIARVVIPNKDGSLRAGMFVDVRLIARIADDAVLVPEVAVIRSGEKNTVFVSLPGGSFEPREVKLGARGDGGLYQVAGGIKAGETVVTSGQFMLDSESHLREVILKMGKRPAD